MVATPDGKPSPARRCSPHAEKARRNRKLLMAHRGEPLTSQELSDLTGIPARTIRDGIAAAERAEAREAQGMTRAELTQMVVELMDDPYARPSDLAALREFLRESWPSDLEEIREFLRAAWRGEPSAIDAFLTGYAEVA
jgi:hypothetical protein